MPHIETKEAGSLGLEHIGLAVEFFSAAALGQVPRIFTGTLLRIQHGDTHAQWTLAPDLDVDVHNSTTVAVLDRSVPAQNSIADVGGPTGPKRKIRGLDS